MTWLPTGGAGYIGGHIVAAMRKSGREVVVLDDLSTGDPRRLPRDVTLVEGSILDAALVSCVVSRHRVSGVIHLAAKKSVPESVTRPLHYSEQNVTGTASLLVALVGTGVTRVLYSSTAAVYGETQEGAVAEEHPTMPTNPYGASKLAAEHLVRHVGRAHGLSTVALRYFNVAGAGSPVLADRGASNLVPLVLRALTQERPAQVFGDDYPTPDGTCIRDYLHVVDLAEAHVAAASVLERSGVDAVYNIGRGRGVSVLEVLDAVRRVTGLPLDHAVAPRRPGDPASVVACADAAREGLGWTARRDLDAMVADAWRAWQDQRARCGDRSPASAGGSRPPVRSRSGPADLGPQGADIDIDVDVVGGGVEVVAPHVTRDLLAREHLVVVAHEHLDERELPGGEVDTTPGHVGPARAQVQGELALTQDRRGASVGAYADGPATVAIRAAAGVATVLSPSRSRTARSVRAPVTARATRRSGRGARQPRAGTCRPGPRD